MLDNQLKETRIDNLFLFFFVTLAWTWFMGFIPLIFFFAVVCGTTILISLLFFGGTMPEFGGIRTLARQPYMIFMFLFFAIMSGLFNEEFGWRGFALDKLFIRYGFWKGSVILGIIWGILHFPWYFYQRNGQYIFWHISPIATMNMVKYKE